MPSQVPFSACCVKATSTSQALHIYNLLSAAFRPIGSFDVMVAACLLLRSFGVVNLLWGLHGLLGVSLAGMRP